LVEDTEMMLNYIQPAFDDGTSGSLQRDRPYYVPQAYYERVLWDLRNRASIMSNEKISEQCNIFIHLLEDRFRTHRISVDLPNFYVQPDDRELYLEWIFSDYRFGFNFREDNNRSEWFMVYRSQDSTRRQRGHLWDDLYGLLDSIVKLVKRDMGATQS